MSTEYPKRIPRKLLAIRTRLTLTPNEMALKIGAQDGAAVEIYERGEGEAPVVILLRYAQTMGISSDFVLDDSLDLPMITGGGKFIEH